MDSEEEIVSLVKDFLEKKGKAKTEEIEGYINGLNKKCPDKTVLFLMKLKVNNIIEGEFSLELGTWIWWICNKNNKQV
jgi:hypothetical protein